ncbi:MAG: hypothetical protein ABIX12_06345 [Rubrivivax sp.]
MLHRNMDANLDKRLGLEDLLGDLRHARRRDDLGRLALLAYCELRRWARHAGEDGVAQRASTLFTASPHVSREAFLAQIDALMAELEQLDRMYVLSAARHAVACPTRAVGGLIHG